MPHPLHLQLLGGFTVTQNEQPVRSFRAAKTRALLAYLATEADQEHSRDKLATLFWGELSESAAKTNLRIELSNLKSVLSSHPALDLTRYAVAFRSTLAASDLHTFERTVSNFLSMPAEAQTANLANLAAALDLYQGEFLTGFHLNDAPDFEDWLLIRREQLHELMMSGLNTLQTRYAQQGRWAELATSARRQIALVPWGESAHRSLMQALAAQGQTQAALVQFEKCCEILKEELGVEPAIATLELAARLRGEGTAAVVIQHNLTQPLKAFVGRKAEITKLYAWAKSEKAVTILGIGGVGKSHLAQDVAQNVLSEFAAGVWFVPLATLEAATDATEETAERIALAIAASIGFPITNLRSPLAELAAHLSGKSMLLVLDNWEHLADAAPLIFDTLHGSGVHILATSRVRLQVEGERVLPLEGLPRNDAYALFVERARRIVPSFVGGDVQDDPQAMIFTICDQVDGLPLGIELAASWVEHFSVAEISQSIGAIAVQPQQADALLARHHSLSSVFEFSWQLLTPRQQQILAALSLFHGGFDRVAAAVVTGSTLQELSVLIAHSLVHRVTAGRYDLHPLIQEFATGKLAIESPPFPLTSTLHTKYAHHYLNLLCATAQTAWKTHLSSDSENIRVAWQRAIHAHDVAIVEFSARIFGEYVFQTGLMRDGYQLLDEAIAQFEEANLGQHEADVATTTIAQNELVAQLLCQQALIARSMSGLQGAAQLQRRALTLTSHPKTRFFCHFDLANYHAEIGEWDVADVHFDYAEEEAKKSGELTIYVESIEGRININAIHFRGDFAQYIVRLQELIRLLDDAQSNDLRSRLHILQSATLVAIRYGDYALAVREAKQSIALAEEAGMSQRVMHLLLDLALAEQFAGLYDASIAHNQEALTYAEEVGDVDEATLLKANLCLVLRQAGELGAALAYGLAAIETVATLGNRRIEGQARNRVGHTLAALDRWEEAYAMYAEALTVWLMLQHPNRYEAIAGHAAAAIHLGKIDEAVAEIDEVLAFVAEQGLVGIVEPARLLLNCESVLAATGQIERSRHILHQAHTWMQTIAARISNEEMRAAFFHNRPDNQLIHKRLQAFAL